MLSRVPPPALGTATAGSNVTWTANTSGVSLDARGYAGTGTTFGGTNVSASLTLNSNGLVMSLSGGAGAAGNTGFVSAGTATASLGTVVFSDSNGVSFGVDGQTVTASHNGLTSQSNQALSGSNGSFTFQTATFGNLNGMSFYTSNGSVVGSYTVPSTAGLLSAVNVSAGTTSNNLSAVTFANAGNVSFGLNGSTVTATATFAQTNQSAIKAFGVSNTGQTAGNTGVSTGIDWVLAGSGSITLSQSTNAGGPNTVWVQHPAWLTTAMQSNAVTLSNVRVSAGTTSNLLSAVTFANANGVSFGLDASTVTASHNGLTSQSNQNVTAGNGGFAFQTLSFSNVNGISFGTSAGSAITASHNAITTARASNDAIGLNTAQSNVTWTANSAGLSLDARGYAGTGTAITGGASITLNSGGLSFNGTALAGTGTTFGGANISGSITQNTAGLNLSLSVAPPGAAAENNWVNLLGANTAGNTTASGSTIGYSGINLTLSGTNGSVVNISAPATSSLSATGALSVSTNGSTISMGVGPFSAYAVGNTTLSSSGAMDLRSASFAGSGDVYVGVSNGSVVVSGAGYSDWFPHNGAVIAAHQVGQNSIQVQPAPDSPFISFDRLGYGIQYTQATNSTLTVSCTVRMGLYSKNASTLSLITSHSGSFSINGSGTASSSNNSGLRWATMTLNGAGSIFGDVWVAFHSSTATAGNNATLSNLCASRLNSTWSGILGVGTAASVQYLPGMGFWSTTTNALPNSMAFSHITGNSSSAQRPQVFFLTNGALPI